MMLSCCSLNCFKMKYHIIFILTWNNHWYSFDFCPAILSSLICLSWWQESFFLPLIVISGLLICQALSVLHLCRFQQLQHFYYWHHHHLCHHHYLKSLHLDHRSFLRHSATKGWTVEVAMDWKFQLNIVYMVKKRFSNGWIKN